MKEVEGAWLRPFSYTSLSSLACCSFNFAIFATASRSRFSRRRFSMLARPKGAERRRAQPPGAVRSVSESGMMSRSNGHTLGRAVGGKVGAGGGAWVLPPGPVHVIDDASSSEAASSSANCGWDLRERGWIRA